MRGRVRAAAGSGRDDDLQVLSRSLRTGSGLRDVGDEEGRPVGTQTGLIRFAKSGSWRTRADLEVRPTNAGALLRWYVTSPAFSKLMKFGVIVFPGSNCDHDAWFAVNRNLGHRAEFIWHDSATLGDIDAAILPGGFAYGDYLRCGAIAKFSPVMAAVRKFAADGGLVLGICNGFQILVEAGLLPGALMRNRNLKFICREVRLRTETLDSPFTAAAEPGQVLRMPIAHGEGSYVADARTLDELESEDRVAFRYEDNPNGFMLDVAGILNAGRNVMGMMPHPERATEPLMGSSDGLVVFRSMVTAGEPAALQL